MRDKDLISLENLYNKVINESSHGLRGGNHNSDFNIDWTEDDENSDQYFTGKYSWNAHGSHTYATYMDPAETDLNIDVDIYKIVQSFPNGEEKVIYSGEAVETLPKHIKDIYDRIEEHLKEELYNSDSIEPYYGGED